MIKVKTDSYCEEKGNAILTCPHCGEKGVMPVFSNKTGICLNSIQVKEIHDHYFAVCVKCKNTFGVAE